jgi:hypothetical protein
VKATIKSLILTSAAFCATAAFAANQARVNVPFSFTAKGQSYPAGSYDLVLDASNNFVTMENDAQPSKHITWMVGPAEPSRTGGSVKFDEVGENYTLSTIHVGTRITPNLDSHKKGISATTTISGQ